MLYSTYFQDSNKEFSNAERFVYFLEMLELSHGFRNLEKKTASTHNSKNSLLIPKKTLFKVFLLHNFDKKIFFRFFTIKNTASVMVITQKTKPDYLSIMEIWIRHSRGKILQGKKSNKKVMKKMKMRRAKWKINQKLKLLCAIQVSW